MDARVNSKKWMQEGCYEAGVGRAVIARARARDEKTSSTTTTTDMVSHHALGPRCARSVRVPGKAHITHHTSLVFDRPHLSPSDIAPGASRPPLVLGPLGPAKYTPLAVASALSSDSLQPEPRAPCTGTFGPGVHPGSMETRCEGTNHTRGDLQKVQGSGGGCKGTRRGDTIEGRWREDREAGTHLFAPFRSPLFPVLVSLTVLHGVEMSRLIWASHYRRH